MSRPSTPRQIAEIANGLVDPILARRAGISTMLLGVWDEIVGDTFADCTRPERIAWPHRGMGGEDEFLPGQLVVACDGARALFFSHQVDEMIGRVNGFFGYRAIDRIRIVQKPVAKAQKRRRTPRLADNEKERLREMLGEIEDPGLQAALERLGTAVMGARGRRGIRKGSRLVDTGTLPRRAGGLVPPHFTVYPSG